MNIAINSLIVLIAVLHFYFLILEMFLWAKPVGLKTFRQTLEQAKASAVLAANQGLYNGFLSVGLIFSLCSSSPEVSYSIKVLFLSFIICAGIYGGVTANQRIIYVQAAPAALALVLVLMGI